MRNDDEILRVGEEQLVLEKTCCDARIGWTWGRVWVSRACLISQSWEMVSVGLEIGNSFPWMCEGFSELLVDLLQVVLGIASVWDVEI